MMMNRKTRQGAAAAPVCTVPPIRLHPENPRWFEWLGQAVALVTSAERYGAVLNLAGGRWVAEWISVEDGQVLQRDMVVAEAGGERALAGPRFTDAVALGLRLQ